MSWLRRHSVQKNVCLIALIFLILFTIIPVEFDDEQMQGKSNRKVTGVRCIYHMFRSFHMMYSIDAFLPLSFLSAFDKHEP